MQQSANLSLTFKAKVFSQFALVLDVISASRVIAHNGEKASVGISVRPHARLKIFIGPNGSDVGVMSAAAKIAPPPSISAAAYCVCDVSTGAESFVTDVRAFVCRANKKSDSPVSGCLNYLDN